MHDTKVIRSPNETVRRGTMPESSRPSRALPIVLFAGALVAVFAVPRGPVQPVRPEQIRAANASQPLHFEPNVGQANVPGEFTARGPGYTLHLARGQAILSLRRTAAGGDARRASS